MSSIAPALLYRNSMQFTQELSQFISSKGLFKILFQTSIPKTSIHILDSSFNPPHYGHLELIKSAPSTPQHVILLLSLNNADKPSTPASFNQRLEMMYEFGQSIGLEYSICVLKSPRFIDKSLEINSFYPSIEKYYLMGYDTLVRVLNSKYYQDPIEMVLNNFMLQNKFICLTRSQEYLYQLEYLDNLKNGRSSLPSEWGKSIFLVKNDKPSSLISSSDIRNRVKSESIQGLTVDAICDYIKQNKLYV